MCKVITKKILYPLVLLSLLVGIGLPFAKPVYAATYTLYPNGVGTYTNITNASGAPHWGEVDEVVADDAATWVRHDVYAYGYVEKYDTYALPNTMPSVSSISSITVYWRGAGYYNAGSFATIYGRSMVYIGGTPSYGAYQSVSLTVPGWNTWADYNDTWATNPTTGLAWTQDDINNLEIGVSLRSYGAASAYCWMGATQVYVVVDYTAPSVPTVTTSAASNISCTTATLNGNVASDGGNTDNVTVTVYWGDNDGGITPGSWDNSSAPTSPAQPQGIASFYKNAIGLAEDTIIYFTAKATNSTGTSWGATQSFTTWGDPIITTVDATDITVTTARLQSYLNDGGGTTCQVRFGWGSIDKGTDIDAYNGVGSPSAFAGAYTIGQSPYLDVDNLATDNTTYFNVQAQNVCGSDNGTSKSFATESSVGSPSNVTAIPNVTSIILSWSKGVGAPNTFIRRRENACSDNYTDGTLVYMGTASTYTDTGLTSGIDYCYYVIGYDSVAGYSSGHVIIHATTLAAGLVLDTTGTAIVKPSGMVQTPDISAMLEANIPLMPSVRAASTSTGIPMGSVLYGILLIILTGLSYGIYKWNHSIEWIVVVWFFANWIAYPTLHIPLVVPIFVSLVGLGYGAYRIRSLI